MTFICCCRLYTGFTYSDCGLLNSHHRLTWASFRHICSAARNSCEGWSIIKVNGVWVVGGAHLLSNDLCLSPLLITATCLTRNKHAYRDAEPCQQGAESPVLIPASHIQINKPFFPQLRDLSSHRWDNGSNNPLSVAFFCLPRLFLPGIHLKLMTAMLIRRN